MPRRRATGVVALLFIAAACAAPGPDVSRATPASTTPPDRAPAGLSPGKVLFSKGGVDLWTAAPDGTRRVGVTTDGVAGGYVRGRWAPDRAPIAPGRAGSRAGGSALF